MGSSLNWSVNEDDHRTHPLTIGVHLQGAELVQVAQMPQPAEQLHLATTTASFMLRKLEMARLLFYCFLLSFDPYCIDTTGALAISMNGIWKQHLSLSLVCVIYIFLIWSQTVKNPVCQERRGHNNYKPHPCSFWPTRPREKNHSRYGVCFFQNLVYTYMYSCIHKYTSSTARGGGGSFEKRKTIGEIGCCESRMSKQKH